MLKRAFDEFCASLDDLSSLLINIFVTIIFIADAKIR